MGIKITYPKEWYDHQPRYCSACHKSAMLKIEVRVDGGVNDSAEYGPAQTLRLCTDHADILLGCLHDEVYGGSIEDRIINAENLAAETAAYETVAGEDI